MAKKKQLPEEVVHSEAYVKDFFDMIVPSTVKFNVDHYICGDSYRCVWAIKEYPPQTSDQAILSRFGDKEAVTLHLYTRFVDGAEQRKILQNASRKNKMLANSNDIEDAVTGEGNLDDVVELLNDLRKNREPLLHYPVMADLYELVESEYQRYEHGSKSLFTEDLLRELCLGLNSMCVGAESKFFNGHTNISDDKFLVFGVKGLMEANKKLKDAMLFNILSFMNHKLLTKGNTAASIDELYLFLTNLTAIEYIRNASKRVRKKDSSILLASQNIEDFLLPEVKEMTKPLFSIPTHQFLFNAGNINPKEYMDALQLEQSEYELIKYPERGTCLFKCGNERYLLQVNAPEYKAKLFGNAGGR